MSACEASRVCGHAAAGGSRTSAGSGISSPPSDIALALCLPHSVRGSAQRSLRDAAAAARLPRPSDCARRGVPAHVLLELHFTPALTPDLAANLKSYRSLFALKLPPLHGCWETPSQAGTSGQRRLLCVEFASLQSWHATESTAGQISPLAPSMDLRILTRSAG